MGGSGEAIALVIIEVMLVATTWFIYSIDEADRQAWMAHRYGDRGVGAYRRDPTEA
jgi:hypothetical protein